LTVTVKVFGTLPDVGLTVSHGLSLVAENVAPLAPVTESVWEVVAPPACTLLKVSVVGETTRLAPGVTVRLTEIVVGLPLEGVNVTVPVYGVMLGCNPLGLMLTDTVAGVLVAPLTGVAASQLPCDVAVTVKDTADPVELVTETV
jgi:hypothetical protein